MIALSMRSIGRQNPAYRLVLRSFTLKHEGNEYRH